MESTSNLCTPKEKNDFGNMFLKILNAINYETVSLYSDPKRFHELSEFESYKEMGPFVEWFTQSITEKNCVTTQELSMYEKLKRSGDLVPDNDLDTLIGSFCSDTSYSNMMSDLEPSIDAARKELEALESLEKLLKEIEEYKSSSLSEIVESEISSELSELDELNTQLNCALEDFAGAWQDLRSNISLDSKELTEVITSINDVEKEISDKLNYNLSNDFKEVRPTDGLLNIKIGNYRIVFDRLAEVRKDIVKTVSNQEGLVVYNKCLHHLKSNLNATLSLEEIRDLLYEPYSKGRLTNSLNELLQNEKVCLYNIQIDDVHKGKKYLEDRLARLTKIEYTLNQKKLYHHTLLFVTKSNLLVRDLQFDKLEKFLQMIETYYNKYEDRTSYMKGYLPKNEEFIDQNFKKMMQDLNVNNMDLSSLDAEISELHKKRSEIYENIGSDLYSFQLKVLQSLRSCKENVSLLMDGPTREISRQLSSSVIEPLESIQKELLAIEKKTNKIKSLYQEVKPNEINGDDCVWLKCFNNPKDFINQIQEMEEKLQNLMLENIQKNL